MFTLVDLSICLKAVSKVVFILSCGLLPSASAPMTSSDAQSFEYAYGAITRGNKANKQIALVFTGDEYADGAQTISNVLKSHNVPGSFFLTGRFYRNPKFQPGIKSLIADGHYLGAHSDEHLLYCDWVNRDSLLITKQEFIQDIEKNYDELDRLGITKHNASYFLPPYEWYNDSISAWTNELGLTLINFTHGTLSHADYTTPSMTNYRSSEVIYSSIMTYEQSKASGLNGFILLSHIGTAPERIDKFYPSLDNLIRELQKKGYVFLRIDELLKRE